MSSWLGLDEALRFPVTVIVFNRWMYFLEISRVVTAVSETVAALFSIVTYAVVG